MGSNWQPSGSGQCRLSSAAVAYPLRVYRVLRDSLLHATIGYCVVICITVTSLSASTSLALLLWPLSFTTHFGPRTAAHWLLCVFAPFSANPLLCMEIRGDPWFLRYQQTFHGQIKVETAEPCLQALMHIVAATWLADSIFALTSWFTASPNKVITEYIFNI